MKVKKILICLIVSILIFNIVLFCYFLVNRKEKTVKDLPQQTAEIIKAEKIFLKLIPDIKQDLINEKIDFVEINLSEMKTRLFNGGEVILEFPILARGNLNNWGAWAVAAEVYRPYAIHFYGKYYIHGEPYYPNGKKMVSDFSGGCVRLADQDVKKLYSTVKTGMPVLIIDKEKDNYDYPDKELTTLPNINAEAFLVADMDNGSVLIQKNQDEILPIASLTKLMTAIIVSENINLEKYITITEQMLKDGYGSTTDLNEKESYRIVELFYPLLIESSNDAAMALASYLGKNTTIAKMNTKASMMLMKNSQFSDVSGYDPGNVSSATDLFQIARYVTNVRPLIWDITKGKKVLSFGSNRFLDTKFWNKNIFYLDNTLIGGKTGFTKESKSTGIFVFRFFDKEKNIRNITFILLGSNYLKGDTQKLYNWVSKNYFTN
jgi:D-alanyl-D-alanine carboxypeptidase